MSGRPRRTSSAARRPSSVWVGGIRTSTIARSGWCCARPRSTSAGAVADRGDGLDRRRRRAAGPAPRAAAPSPRRSRPACAELHHVAGQLGAARRSGPPSGLCTVSIPSIVGRPVGQPGEAAARARRIGAADCRCRSPRRRTRRFPAATCTDARVAPRAWPRWSAPRPRRSRRCSPPPRAGRRPARRTSTGTGARAASATARRRAPGRSGSPGGCPGPGRAARRSPAFARRGPGRSAPGLFRVVVELGSRARPRSIASGQQPLLGAVVQVALDPAPLGLGRVDAPGPAGPQPLLLAPAEQHHGQVPCSQAIPRTA